ncbi:MAG: HlyD family efflux transporter periplasmic adaptor subunit [Eubacteriales bacterium]|nr:HlyD family efflux transporter periplasmic adaptor subunit [Eubacteriales bacterium]
MAKKKRKANVFNFILLLLFLSFLIYLIDNWRVTQETYVLNEGTLEITLEIDAAVIKDERIVYALSDGDVSLLKKQGDRVKSGILIAQQFNDYDSKTISDELNIINEIISVKQGNKVSNDKVGSSYNNEIKNDIQNALFSKDYRYVMTTVNNLDTSDFNYRYSGYESYSLEELISHRDSLRKSVSSEKISYYSPSGGIVSYSFDGLEMVYAIDRLAEISLNDVRKLNYQNYNTLNKTIKNNDPMFKIIDNFDWFFAFEIDKSYMTDIQDKNNLKIRLKKIDKVINTTVFRVQDYGEKSLLILQTDKFLHDYLDDRYIKVDLILHEFSGLTIHKDSIVEQDGLIGVYVSDTNKVVRFRPVEIIGESEEFAVVNEGEKVTVGSRGSLLINGEYFNTIKIFDNIIVKPENVYDGQILR